MHKLTVLTHLLMSWVACFIVASLLHTQSVLYRLTELGIIIPIKQRVHTILEDVMGLAPTYGLIILAGLGISFFVSSLVLKKTKINPIFLYIVAGSVAIATILSVMQPILNVTLLGGARGALGFASQCIAGGLGGMLFGALRTQRRVS